MDFLPLTAFQGHRAQVKLTIVTELCPGAPLTLLQEWTDWLNSHSWSPGRREHDGAGPFPGGLLHVDWEEE